ncbi:hypothetical protein [Sulfurirhabdus autotrophica]|nr:hypothetical protein [Sulfurirhabdus autotrophica]
MTLNECRSQTLEITHNNIVRKVKLPELSKFSARLYQKVGGNINELYVTQWGCGHSDKINVAILYYSIGGGSAPYADSSAMYAATGVLIEDEKFEKYRNATRDGLGHLKSVRSIMPD